VVSGGSLGKSSWRTVADRWSIIGRGPPPPLVEAISLEQAFSIHFSSRSLLVQTCRCLLVVDVLHRCLAGLFDVD